MKKPFLLRREPFLAALLFAFLFTACYEFETVNQPGSVDLNSKFTVEITMRTTDGDNNSYIPYFGIKLPIGWMVTENVQYTGPGGIGTFTYSDTLTENMEEIDPADPGYCWWVGAGTQEVLYNYEEYYQITAEIMTDNQAGNFYLDYMMGSNSAGYGGGLNYQRSNDHLVTVGLPDNLIVTSSANAGPGSLREAIDNIDFNGTITFDLGANNIITLDSQLVVYKNVHLLGPEGDPITLDGNQTTRVLYIPPFLSPHLENLILTHGAEEQGAGIYCDIGSEPLLENMEIAFNNAGNLGGGVHLYDADPVLKNVDIHHNTADLGAGIFCAYNASPYLKMVDIHENSASEYGGGMYSEWNAMPVFDSIERCNIYLNNALYGTDLVSDNYLTVIVDTFTVLEPTNLHAQPISNFSFDILNGKIEQVSADLYVSPTGSNNNSGLTPDDPLKTINAAMLKLLANEENPLTVHLLEGTFSPSSNGESFPIVLKEYISLEGTPEMSVTLDAENVSNLLLLEYNDHCTIKDMILTGGFNENGGAIYTYSSDPVLENLVITGNTATNRGGGMYFNSSSHPELINVTVKNNTSHNRGGGIYRDNSASLVFDSINRCNIYLNEAIYGGDFYSESSQMVNAVVDTFTVLLPTEYHAYPIGNYNFDVLHGLVEQVEADLYVSPDGDNLNSGLTADTPLKNIRFAYSKLLTNPDNPLTINILDGTYSPSSNDEMFPILTRDYVYLTGNSAETVSLDAEQTNRVLEISNNQESGISNLFITGGNTPNGGGGIYMNNSNPTIDNVIFQGNTAYYGGGISSYSSNPTITNSTFVANQVQDAGGGIYCDYSSPLLEEVSFSDNIASYGGGMYLYNSSPDLSNVQILNNTANNYGGAIYCNYESAPALEKVSIHHNTAYQGGGIYLNNNYNTYPQFDSLNRSSIYLNEAEMGGDLYAEYFAEIIVDTFTVIYPKYYHAYPLSNFSFDILHGMIPQVEADLYVSPNGDSTNTGLTPDDPLKTIGHALLTIAEDSLNLYTIHLLSGVYSPTSNGESFPLILAEYVNLEGISPDSVIIDAEQSERVLFIEGIVEVKVSGLTIQGGQSYSGAGVYCSNASPEFENVVFKENHANDHGGGFFCEYQSHPRLYNCTFSGNEADYSGGGLCLFYECSVDLETVEFTENTANYGAGIYLDGADGMLEDVVLNNNEASNYGGGIYCSWESYIELASTSIRYNQAENGGGIYCEDYSEVVFDSTLRCNIYQNSGIFGRDLYSTESMDVVVDTFTVLYPTEFFVHPFDNFSFDILHGKLVQVNADLYVSPDGNDENSGLSADEPLKTINTAFSKMMADSTHQHTIWLLEGTYGPSSNGDNFPINMIDYISLSGTSQSGVQLDGEDQYGILHFDEAHGTSVSNMMLKRGRRNYGAGIYCYESSPILSNLTLMNNQAYDLGGGIYCSDHSDPQLNNINFVKNKAYHGAGMAILDESSPTLMNCDLWLNHSNSRGGAFYIADHSDPVIQEGILRNNTASHGGALYCSYQSDLQLNEVTIFNNSANQGGGMYFEGDCQIQLSGVDVFQNTAQTHGGGIYSDNGMSPVFDTLNRCNIYLNKGEHGRDLYTEHSIQVIVDTFTVLYPTKIFADPLPYFEFDILHGLIDQIDADLYVSPDGDDDNSGLTPEDPLKTIYFANTRILADSSSPHTIYLLPGTYSDSITGEIFPVNTLDYVTLSGTSTNAVILHGGNSNRLLEISNTIGTVITEITLKGGYGVNGAGIAISNASPLLEDLVIEQNTATNAGGGIFITNYADPILHHITISNNTANDGGGLYCSYQSNPELAQVIISGNTAQDDGGGICMVDHGNVYLDSVTIVQNHSNDEGGGIYIYDSEPIFSNVIITDNTAGDRGGGIYFDDFELTLTDVTISNNTASTGGGMYSYRGNSLLSHTNISENSAYYEGGGIYNQYANYTFDSLNRSNIYLNYAEYGSDLALHYNNTMHVIVDTFTVLKPKWHQASPLTNFTFDILHGMLPQEELQLYVSPTGDNGNTGFSPEEPFKTINFACEVIASDSLNLYDINLLEGTYSPSSNGEVFPVFLDDYVGISGTSNEEVMLDAEGTNNLLRIESRRDVVLSNMTLTGGDGSYEGGGIYMYNCNSYLENLILTDNTANNGGAIYGYNSEVTMLNTILSSNTATNLGGGLYLGYCSSSSLQNSIVKENLSYASGGGIYSNETVLDMENVQIIDNESSNDGGGLYCNNNSDLTISQSVFTGNAAEDAGGALYSDYSTIHLSGTSIHDNVAENTAGGIYSRNNNTVIFDTVTRCNIYLNEAQTGYDLYSQNQMVVVLDTFTVLYPKAHHAYPLPNFTFDILNGMIPQIHADLYVSPAGDDENTGLSPDDPLKTINYALSIVAEDSVNIYTINLLEGTYGPSSNGENFPIYMVHYVNLEGAGIEDVLLDGEGTSRVIEFNGVMQAGISDLSITGGNAENDDGGGIYCNQSSPSIQRIKLYENQASNGGGISIENHSYPILNDLEIYNNEANYGGGIYCEYNADPVIIDVSLTNNSAGQGGAIAAYQNSNPELKDIEISDNIALNYGGGIYCNQSSSPYLENVRLINNTAQSEGGGVWCSSSSTLHFDTLNRSTIYMNQAPSGNELYSENQMMVVVDTFTVLYPKSFHAYPRYNFEFDILVGLIPQVHADLYVSPQGDNGNSGLTPDDPLKTINFATSIIAEDSLNMYTIHLANGIYSPSTNEEIFPVFLPEYIGIEGEHKYETILDAEETAMAMHLSYSTNVLVKNMTIRNGNNPDGYGGGIYLEYSNPEFIDVFVTQNYARYGGGMFLDHSSPSAEGLSITYNESFYGGAGMCIYDYSNPQISNSTIENNTAGTYGGGVYCSSNSSPHFKDVLFEYNGASTGAAFYSSNHSDPVLEKVVITNNEAEHSGGGIYAPYSNMKILDSEISNNTSTSKGGGIYLSSCDATIENTLITNNIAKDGGGMYYSASDPVLVDVVITNNVVTRYGGGLYFSVCNPVLENLTIAGNEADMGSGIYSYRSDMNLMDAILWNEPLNEIWFKETGSPSSITLACTAIQEGEDAIITNGNGTVIVVGGLMEDDPMFLGGDDHPHQLSESSPYIDLGMIDTAGMHLPTADILGNHRIWDGTGNGIARVDLGAYEFGAPAVITGLPEPRVQSSRLNVQGYPNPFSDRITLSFEGQKTCRIRVSVADLTGNEVLLLADGVAVRNNQKLSFNLEELDKGIYFLRISDGNAQETIKMVKIR